MTDPAPLDPPLEDELRTLVDEYRTRCLWFLRPDHYPRAREEVLRVLRHIERHGDREGLRASREAATMALTDLQRSVCRLLAEHRIRPHPLQGRTEISHWFWHLSF